LFFQDFVSVLMRIVEFIKYIFSDFISLGANFMEQSILIADEVAEILRVDRQRVYELVRSNSIPFIKLGERQYRFSRPAIENWLGLNGTAKQQGEKEQSQWLTPVN
jgi:excisionase family DNA binding protein